MRIQIYDTTLRDGTQSESVAFSVEDKIRVARELDQVGVSYIEGGWPGSNEKDAEFFRRASSLTWHNARLSAFGSTDSSQKFSPSGLQLEGAAGSFNADCHPFWKILGSARHQSLEDSARQESRVDP